jgi:hypothetical protein
MKGQVRIARTCSDGLLDGWWTVAGRIAFSGNEPVTQSLFDFF